MAQYDLTPRIIPFLDRHMTLPLLEFLEERKLYDPRTLLKAKMTFAESTKMLDLYASEYKAYHGDKSEPPQLDQRRQVVYNEMHAYQTELGDLLGLLADEVNDNGEVVKPAPALTLREQNQFTAEYLLEHYNITAQQIDLLFRYAKFNFEIGRYRDAADQLFYYRELVKAQPPSMSAEGIIVDNQQSAAAATNSYWALWGKCAGEILMANMDVAYNDLQQLFALLESNVHADQLEQLQQRTWLLHWSLFVFFNLPNGRALLIEFFMQEKMLNTIQVNAPHLLRYLTATVILNRRRKNILKDLIKILVATTKELPVAPSTSNTLAYTDPLIDFILSLYVDYNFEAALKHLNAARTMLSNDFFLTDALAQEIIENARIMLFEVYCSVHSRVDMKKMAQAVDLTQEIKLDKDGELVLEAAPATEKKSNPADDDSVLVSMIRACHVQARIDSYHNELFLTGEHPSIYSQVMQRTNNATFRTQQLAQGIAKRIVGKRQQAEAE